MSHSEALELIADESQLKQITLTDEQATRLYKRTGGVPLAIVWSVAQMSVSHNIEATLTHLGQPTSDIARFCFDAALHLIRHKPAHKLLMALSLFATDASRDALGYVTELPILDRDEGLEELEKLSLLNKEEGRFSLLPLTRVYSEMALQQIALQQRFRERWVAYYVRFLLNRKNNKYDSINDVKLDWRNILDVMDYCWNTKKLNEFVTLIEEMEFYFWITLQWESWDNYGILGITAATSIHKSLSAAEIYRMLGNLNDFRANFSQAKYFITKSIEIYNSLGNKKGLATALWRLASIEMQCHEYDKAKNSIQKSLAIAEKINNENLIIIIKCRYAEICMLESNYEYADVLLKHVQKWHDKTEKYTWDSRFASS